MRYSPLSNPLIVGTITFSVTFFMKAASAKGTGLIAPIPPVFGTRIAFTHRL